VDSKIHMKKNLLTLENLKFQVNNGTHNGTATFDLNSKIPQYTFSSRLRDVDANEFLSQNTSLKNMLYGKFSSDMEMKGAGTGFDEISRLLKGNGKATLVAGRITSFNMAEQVAVLGKLAGIDLGKGGTEIEDLVSNFAVQDGRVSTSALKARLSGLTLRANGTFGFDKTADYQILVELPPAQSKKYQASNSLFNLATATFFTNENGNVVLPLRMTGLITNPRFALDTKAIQDNLKTTFRKEGVQRTLDALQNAINPKQKQPSSTTPPASGSAEKQAAPEADKQPPKKEDPLGDLLRGVMDKAKEKGKKKDDQKQ